MMMFYLMFIVPLLYITVIKCIQVSYFRLSLWPSYNWKYTIWEENNVDEVIIDIKIGLDAWKRSSFDFYGIFRIFDIK